MGLVADIEAVLCVRFRLPPGISPEAAGKMLSQGGVNVPLGLVNNIRKVDVAIVKIDEPYLTTPPEDGGNLFSMQ